MFGINNDNNNDSLLCNVCMCVLRVYAYGATGPINRAARKG